MQLKYLFFACFFSLCNLKQSLHCSTEETKKLLTKLYYACMQDHFTTIEDILNSHAHQATTLINSKIPDEQLNNSLLHIAVYHNSLNAVSILLQHNAKIDARNKLGMTPLHYAVHEQYISIIIILLAHHASLDIPDLCYKTPWHYALASNNLIILDLLNPPLPITKPPQKTFSKLSRNICIAASLAAITLCAGIPFYYQ